MDLRLLRFIIIGLATALIATACAPEATPPPVDIAGTLAVELASVMLTQTAAAYSPTPPPSPTPQPVTDTPIPTDTVTPEPSGDPSIRIVTIIGEPDPPCTFGPGSSYEIQSYIHTPKQVELLGVGSVPGWYVIKNPYFGAACWLPTERVEIDPAMDLSTLPVIAP